MKTDARPPPPVAAAPTSPPRSSPTSRARLGLAWVADGRGRRDGGTFGPEDVFDYMYAVFHAPEYRERYAEFLKIDFPRAAAHPRRRPLLDALRAWAIGSWPST